ncbi:MULTISPECIES: hypothetical protein [unclassified Pseudomonas]|jgi:hypothetical protein|uniref:hypothetical protein n=1 Tax=unclassified Pseudomonas TaxID=196821 RepID=UPI001CBC90D7|nr:MULTISPECIES: hypothetical protein [unclassified Pseudomonas]
MAILTKVSAVNVIGIPFGIDPVLAPQQMFEQNQVSKIPNEWISRTPNAIAKQASEG